MKRQLKKKEVIPSKGDLTVDKKLFTFDVTGDEEIQRKIKTKIEKSDNNNLKNNQNEKEGNDDDKASLSTTIVDSSLQFKKFKKTKVSDKFIEKRLEKLTKKRNKNKNRFVFEKNNLLSDAVKNAGKYDVWSKEVDDDVNNYNDDGDFLQPVKKRKIKEPPTLKLKPTEIIPAIHKPHPGASYNPTFEDHQLLLKIAHEEEVDKLLKKERIAKELPNLELSSNIEDMADDDGNNNNNLSEKEEGEQEEEDDDGDDKNVFTSNKNQHKKTKTERNKEKKKSMLLKEQEEKIAKKNKRKQLEKLNEIIETVEQNTINAEKKLVEKELIRKELSKLPKKKIGKYRVKKLPVEFQLPDELTGSLRKLKPEGNLFQDRMCSLQERNIIEPRVKISKKRKYKLKESEKASYKT